MRKHLAKQEGERATFTATFDRFETKSGWQGAIEKTVLLRDIRDATGRRVVDRLSFKITTEFDDIGLEHGDVVQFDARVKEHIKGYQGGRREAYKPVEPDLKLSHPTNVAKGGRPESEEETEPEV